MHQPDPATCPPVLAAIEARMRALPRDNPRFAADALLIACDYITEVALYCEVGGQRVAADHALRTAERWRALAPLFAPPAAADLAAIEHAVRQEPQA